MLEHDGCDETHGEADYEGAASKEQKVTKNLEGCSPGDFYLADITVEELEDGVEQNDSDGVIDDAFTEKQAEKSRLLLILYHRDGSDNICRAQKRGHKQDLGCAQL